MEKMDWDGPKWAPRGLFPANPDLADILGRTDLDFEIFLFMDFLEPRFLDCQVPDFQNLTLRGLWPGWAGLEPSGPKNVDFKL